MKSYVDPRLLNQALFSAGLLGQTGTPYKPNPEMAAATARLLPDPLQYQGQTGTPYKPAMVPGAPQPMSVRPQPMSVPQQPRPQPMSLGYQGPSFTQGLLDNPEALLNISGGLLAAGAPTTDPGRASTMIGQTLQSTGGILAGKQKERQQEEAVKGLLGSGQFTPQQQALMTAFPQIGAKAAVESAFTPGKQPNMVNMMNPRTQDVRSVPEGSPQQQQLASENYVLMGNYSPEKPSEQNLKTYFDTQKGQFVSITPSDVMRGNGRYVPEQEATRRGVGVKPTTPSTKPAFDRQTGQPVFATEAQIAANPDRYGPVPNGIKLKTNPDGSVQFVSGSLANEADPMGLTNTNQSKQQDAFITAQDTLSSLDQINASYDPRFSTTLGQLEASVFSTMDRAGFGLAPDQSATLEKYTSWQRGVLENLSTTLNRLSGAAVSPDEYKRIANSLPNMEDSPVQFQRKLGDVREKVMLSAMRAHYFMKNGIPTNPQEFGNLSLDGMRGILNDRGNAIQQEVKAANPDADPAWINKQVTTRLKSEFGVGV